MIFDKESTQDNGSAVYRQTDTFRYGRAKRQIRQDDSFCFYFILLSKMKNYPSEKYQCRRARQLPCRRRLYIGTMILLPSHSPSVKSVAGNGGSSVGWGGEVKFLWRVLAKHRLKLLQNKENKLYPPFRAGTAYL